MLANTWKQQFYKTIYKTHLNSLWLSVILEPKCSTKRSLELEGGEFRAAMTCSHDCCFHIVFQYLFLAKWPFHHPSPFLLHRSLAFSSVTRGSMACAWHRQNPLSAIATTCTNLATNQIPISAAVQGQNWITHPLEGVGWVKHRRQKLQHVWQFDWVQQANTLTHQISSNERPPWGVLPLAFFAFDREMEHGITTGLIASPRPKMFQEENSPSNCWISPPSHLTTFAFKLLCSRSWTKYFRFHLPSLHPPVSQANIPRMTRNTCWTLSQSSIKHLIAPPKGLTILQGVRLHGSTVLSA